MRVDFVHMVVAICLQIVIFFSVMLSQLETMGLFPIGVLCIFFRKYNLDVLWFVGGLQYSYQCFRRNLFS